MDSKSKPATSAQAAAAADASRRVELPKQCSIIITHSSNSAPLQIPCSNGHGSGSANNSSSSSGGSTGAVPASATKIIFNGVAANNHQQQPQQQRAMPPLSMTLPTVLNNSGSQKPKQQQLLQQQVTLSQNGASLLSGNPSITATLSSIANSNQANRNTSIAAGPVQPALSITTGPSASATAAARKQILISSANLATGASLTPRTTLTPIVPKLNSQLMKVALPANIANSITITAKPMVQAGGSSSNSSLLTSNNSRQQQPVAAASSAAPAGTVVLSQAQAAQLLAAASKSVQVRQQLNRSANPSSQQSGQQASIAGPSLVAAGNPFVPHGTTITKITPSAAAISRSTSATSITAAAAAAAVGSAQHQRQLHARQMATIATTTTTTTNNQTHSNVSSDAPFAGLSGSTRPLPTISLDARLLKPPPTQFAHLSQFMLTQRNQVPATAMPTISTQSGASPAPLGPSQPMPILTVRPTAIAAPSPPVAASPPSHAATRHINVQINNGVLSDPCGPIQLLTTRPPKPAPQPPPQMPGLIAINTADLSPEHQAVVNRISPPRTAQQQAIHDALLASITRSPRTLNRSRSMLASTSSSSSTDAGSVGGNGGVSGGGGAQRPRAPRTPRRNRNPSGGFLHALIRDQLNATARVLPQSLPPPTSTPLPVASQPDQDAPMAMDNSEAAPVASATATPAPSPSATATNMNATISNIAASLFEPLECAEQLSASASSSFEQAASPAPRTLPSNHLSAVYCVNANSRKRPATSQPIAGCSPPRRIAMRAPSKPSASADDALEFDNFHSSVLELSTSRASPSQAKRGARRAVRIVAVATYRERHKQMPRRQQRRKAIVRGRMYCASAAAAAAAAARAKYKPPIDYTQTMAPLHLFPPHPFPRTNLSGAQFAVGMKFEAIDPHNASLYCVCSLLRMRGNRLLLSIDGYQPRYAFWTYADSPYIFSPGWVRLSGRQLEVPPAFRPAHTFDWHRYLTEQRALAAPVSLFLHINVKVHNPLRVGTKLEANDVHDASRLRVATVADTLGKRVLLTFDGCARSEDYWAAANSPLVHPVNYHREHNLKLVGPPDLKMPFNWDTYRRATGAPVATAEMCQTRARFEFEPGMHLEVVDRKVPHLIRTAQVLKTDGYQLQVLFVGWPLEYAYWLQDDSPDLHPIGWCERTDHPLEVPPCSSDSIRSQCSFGRCRDHGHASDPNIEHHSCYNDCPYSRLNWPTDFAQDRLTSQPPNEESSVAEPAKQPVATRRRQPSAKLPLQKGGEKQPSSAGARPEEASIAGQVVTADERMPARNSRSSEASSGSGAASASGAAPAAAPGSGAPRRPPPTNGQLLPSPPLSPPSPPSPTATAVRNLVADYLPGTERAQRVWLRNARPLRRLAQVTLAGRTRLEKMRTLPLFWTPEQCAANIARIPGMEETARQLMMWNVNGVVLTQLSMEELLNGPGLFLRRGPAVKLMAYIAILRDRMCSVLQKGNRAAGEQEESAEMELEVTAAAEDAAEAAVEAAADAEVDDAVAEQNADEDL